MCIFNKTIQKGKGRVATYLNSYKKMSFPFVLFIVVGIISTVCGFKT